MTMEQLQRGYDNQLPDSYDEPESPTLTDEGTCPHCRKELEWDGLDDTKAWCPTPGCKYDNGLSEEENRRLWQEGQDAIAGIRAFQNAGPTGKEFVDGLRLFAKAGML